HRAPVARHAAVADRVAQLKRVAMVVDYVQLRAAEQLEHQRIRRYDERAALFRREHRDRMTARRRLQHAAHEVRDLAATQRVRTQRTAQPRQRDVARERRNERWLRMTGTD